MPLHLTTELRAYHLQVSSLASLSPTPFQTSASHHGATADLPPYSRIPPPLHAPSLPTSDSGSHISLHPKTRRSNVTVIPLASRLFQLDERARREVEMLDCAEKLLRLRPCVSGSVPTHGRFVLSSRRT